MSTETQASKPNQDDETSGSDTESASISSPYTRSIKTASLFTESRTASTSSQFSENDQNDAFTPNAKLRKMEKAFLGYYECLIDNSKLLIPPSSFSTASIPLKKLTTFREERKHLILTRIKESPYIKNTSLFIITGKGRKKKGEWSGKMFKELPEWLYDVEHLISGDPIKGLETYEIFINKEVNIEINKITLEKWEMEAEKKNDITHKLALAGFYMKGNDGNDGDYGKTSKCYLEAKNLYLKAAKLGSIDAKLCLGYIYCIGLTKRKFVSDYKPDKAKKLFKKVAKKTDDKRMAGIAMRNIATLYYGKEISPKLHEKMKHIGFRNKKPLYLKKAKKWYKKSLDLEDTENLFEKAVLFDDDNLYAKAKLGRILINKNDINEGLKILKDAAEKGLDMGQTYLGEFYEKEKNYKEAVEFYSKAARQNRGYYSHAAQYRLNELKSKGHVNEDINIEDILEYYRDECKNGYIEVKENFEKIR